MYMTKLSSIADYVTDKISSNDIALREYVTTDCILQNKKGREIATNLPPQSCCLTRYQHGDVLIANIRPYLKKVWFADIDGGASSDVLVFRAKEGHSPSFLYAVLIQDSFFDYVMQGAKGSKMPRGDKEQMLKYTFSIPTMEEQNKISHILHLLDDRISTQNKIIDKLQSLIKGIRNEVFGKLRKSVGFNAMIGDVLSYEQPQSYIVEDTEYTKEGTPVLTANKAFVLGYTSEKEGIYGKGDCIIFDDFTLDCKYVDFPFKVKSSAIKILTAKNKELLRYTFEFLKFLDLSTDEHKRHYIAETQNQEFILPTMQIVRTIANVFSALSLRMEAVVKQRNMFESQKQYLLRQMFI